MTPELALFASLLLICAFRVAAMARHWMRGRRVAIDIPGGVRALPSRYLRDVHDVVARNPRNSRMHASLAGGFVGALISVLLCAIWPGNLPLALLAMGFAGLSAYGARVDIERRRGEAAGLSGGQYAALPWTVLAALVALVGIAFAPFLPAVLRWTALALGFATLGRLAWSAGGGPMRHAFAGAANLVLHPRPARFGGGRSTGLATPDLTGDPLGHARIEEFSIPQLASFDACVQCGRCENACPAFAAGQPLNPKRFVNDLAASLRGGDAVHYAGHGHPGRDVALPDHDNPLVIGTDGTWGIAPETIWSCTTCRACVEACPMMIEHVDAMIDLRRSETLRRGAIATAAQAVLENLAQTDTQCGAGPDARFDWATDLRLPRMTEGVRAEVLLWVGESAFDRRAQKTIRALVALLRRAGIEPHILAGDELDSGDQARRLGDEALFQSLARRNIATLDRHDFGMIVTADPHVLHVIRNEYPALGGRYVVRHHTDLLDELVSAGRLNPAATGGHVTYHDPCYLGRYNGEFDAPRRILAALGGTVTEMARSRAGSHCCGGGGGAPLTDVPGERRIPDMRMQQVRQTGAACVAVACPGCSAMLEGVPDGGAAVRDIAELLLDAVEARA